MLLSLHCTGTTKSAEECDVLIKNMRAMEIRMRLHEQMNVELANKLKAKKLHLELVDCNLHAVEEKI
jgi:cystathionine beta-lyase/cystathionine gamma-synthase